MTSFETSDDHAFIPSGEKPAMTGGPSYKTLPEHKEVFDQFWWQQPERQNRTSSSWWLFILFPEGEAGYGPRQLMFTIAAGVGEHFRVNDVQLPGMHLNRPVADGVDQFDAISLGWYCDGQQGHDPLVHQPATTTLSHEGSLVAWTDCEDGTRRGGEISASTDRPLGLDAHFKGDGGEASFEAWGDLDCRIASPVEALDIDTIAGGVHLATWQRLQFKGDFVLPGGRETLEGLGYFHRACLNVPLFPWKWIWAFFPDGTAFSVMIPYIGPQLFRTGYQFFSHNRMERATIPLRQSGLWDWETAEPLVTFNTAHVKPVPDTGPHPNFAVRAGNEQGDQVRFVASTYGHVRNYLDRPVLEGLVESHWSYNEYLFRMEELKGCIVNEEVTDETMGQGFGTLEYTWGLAL